jgi:hypothetical protein
VILYRVSFATAAAVLLIAVAQAGAAETTEFGDRCTAKDSEAGWTLIGLDNGNAFPLQDVAPPEANSVITRWRTELAPGVGPVRQQLLAFRQVYEGQDRLVGESAIETLVDGVNEFPTRIPIPEYGHIGLRGPEQTLFCDKESDHLAGVVEGPFAVGETRPHTWLSAGVPAIAFIEPDRDGDGYGDLTQDRCTGDAAFYDTCPIAAFRAGGTEVRRRAILVHSTFWVTTKIYATPSMRVTGTVAGATRRRGTPGHSFLFNLDGGDQDVPPDTPTTFRLPLPTAVTRLLARMTPEESFQANLSARVLNGDAVAGREFSRSWTVKLPGRMKPRHHHKR